MSDEMVHIRAPWILKWGMPIVIGFLLFTILLSSIITVHYKVVSNFVLICGDKHSCLPYKNCSTTYLVESVVNMSQLKSIDIGNDISITINSHVKEYRKGKIKAIVNKYSIAEDSVKMTIAITDLADDIKAIPGSGGRIIFYCERTLLRKLVDSTILGVLRQLKLN